MMRNPDEENFEEALNRAYMSYTAYSIPDEIQALLSDPKADAVIDDPYWILVNSLKKFIHNEGRGKLPLLGTVPDMHADTDSYITLQGLYIQKSNQDLEIIRNYVKQTLEKFGKPATDITNEYIKLFCKNCLVLRVIRYRTLEEELVNPLAPNLQANMIDFITMEPGNGVWYVLLRAAERFYAEFHRYPGERKDYAEDYFDLKKHIDALIKEFNLEASQISDEVNFELCRFGNAQIHSITAFLGGVSAQEIIKLITKKWTPMNHTYIYNGIKASSITLEL